MTWDPVEDYRFGWRWLMPGRPVHVMTGDEASDAFVRECIPAHAGICGLLVIDADAWMHGKVAHPPVEPSKVTGYALVGSEHAVRKLTRSLKRVESEMRDYGLLPPASPRVVVPLSSRTATIQGLSLHNPGSFSARVATRLLRSLAKVGIAMPLRRRMLRLIVAEPPLPWMLSGTDTSVWGAEDFALYLGARGPNRKTVCLPISDREGLRHIIKTAEWPLSKRKLANEALMLRHLATSEVAGHIPSLVSFRESDSASVLVQEFRAVSPCGLKKKRDAAAGFLSSLYRERSRRVSIELAIEAVGLKASFHDSERLELLAALRHKSRGLMVPSGLVHGDFAPWNCGVSDGKLVVYDWEEGELDGLPLDDAFSYSVFPNLLVQRISDTGKLAADAIAFAREVHAGNAPDPRLIRVCLALWSIGRPADFFPGLFNRMAREIIDGL